jgi:hypothetical protein
VKAAQLQDTRNASEIVTETVEGKRRPARCRRAQQITIKLNKLLRCKVE